MTEINLFSTIRKYPEGNINPLENCSTEILCYCLNSCKRFSELFLKTLSSDSSLYKQSFTWETQKAIERGFIDLIGYGRENVIIVEVKINACFQEKQITRYYEAFKNTPHLICLLELVSSTDAELLSQKVICDELKGNVKKITWSKLVEVCAEAKQDESSEGSFLLSEFIKYIKSEVALDMKSLNLEALQYFSEARNIESSLKTIFRNLEEKIKLENKEELNYELETRWGRIGLGEKDTDKWNPSLYFGVLLDNFDHKFNLEMYKGPILCYVISVDVKYQTKVESALDFEVFKDGFQKILGSDWKITPGKNKWQVLCAYRPLSEVLNNETGIDKQIELIKSNQKIEEILNSHFYKNLKSTLNNS